MKKIILTFVCLLLSSQTYGAIPQTDKKFYIRLVEDAGTLDWNYGEVSPEIIYQIGEGLFRADKKGKPEMAAASSYQWNKEKTKLIVKIQKKKKWSDGEPLCAQQFVDSWNRLRSKEFASPYAHYANPLKDYFAKSCEELEINFNRAAPEATAFLSHYVFFPLRLDNLKAAPKAFQEGNTLLSNGPYKINSWDLNKRLIMEVNPRFEGKIKPAIKNIEVVFVPEENTAKTLFEQNRIDWMKDIPRLLRSEAMEKSAEFKTFPSLTTYYFGLNANKSSLLKDANLRKALGAALQREEIPKILGKEFRGQKTWLTKELLSSVKPIHFQNIDFAAAKKLLAEAVKKGEMNLVLRTYNKPAHKLLAEWAQGQWEKKLGVRIPIEVQEGKVYWKEISTNPAPIYFSGVTAPYSHPRAYLQEFFQSSTANWTSWTSSEYDQAVDNQDFQKAENLLEESGYVIPLYSKDIAILLQKNWSGFYINPLGQTFLSELR